MYDMNVYVSDGVLHLGLFHKVYEYLGIVPEECVGTAGVGLGAMPHQFRSPRQREYYMRKKDTMTQHQYHMFLAAKYRYVMHECMSV
jgi:hypothetical protein